MGGVGNVNASFSTNKMTSVKSSRILVFKISMFLMTVKSRGSETANGFLGIAGFVTINEELVSKTPYFHSNMLFLCIIDLLLQLK